MAGVGGTILAASTLGGGEAVDGPLAVVGSLVRFFGKEAKVSTTLWKLTNLYLKGIAANTKNAITGFQKFGSFVTRMATNEGFARAAGTAFQSVRAFEFAMKNFDEFGEAFTGAIDDLVKAFTIQSKAIRDASNLLAQLPQATRALIAQVDPAVARDAIKGLITAFNNGIKPELVNRILKNTELFEGLKTVKTNYLPTDFFTDLGSVAELYKKRPELQKDVIKLLEKVAGGAKGGGSGKLGNRYELDVIAKYIRDKGADAITSFGRDVVTSVGKADFDMVINGTYYQIKRGLNAFTNHKEQIDNINEVASWIAKARADGAKKLVYIVPPKGYNDALPDIPGYILEYLKKQGVTTEIVKWR